MAAQTGEVAGTGAIARLRVVPVLARRLVAWTWRHRRWSFVLLIVAGMGWAMHDTGWTAMVLAVWLLPGVVAVVWATFWPCSFEAVVAGPWRRHCWRRMVRRSWPGVADECGLSVTRQAKRRGETVPVAVRPELMDVSARGNRVSVKVRSRVGQTPDDVVDAAPAIASAFEAVSYTATQLTPSVLELALVMADDLSVTQTATEPAQMTVHEVPLGRRQDGWPYALRLQSRHTLVAGCSDSGKGSYLWGVCGGLAPAVHADVVRLWGIDLKGGMEVGMGARLFTATAYTVDEALTMLRTLVEVADARATAMRGEARFHTPTPGDPVHVLVIDELASVVAYETDSKKRAEASRLLSRLLSIGRAPGVLIVAFVQDPSKDTVSMRNLFTQTVALRLRSADEARMVLGEGMASRAPAHKISESAPGMAWVIEGANAERVRADYWTDDLIRHVAARYPALVTTELMDAAEPQPSDAAPDVERTPSSSGGGRKPRKPRAPRGQSSVREQSASDEAA